IAYDCKGPKDIIQDGYSGYLVDDIESMARKIVSHFRWPDERAAMRANARTRTNDYRADAIMNDFVQNLGLPAPACRLRHRPAA
ncbi:MAG: hypothetical protein ACPG1A_01630, partial [Halioglobus sp.]